MANNFDPLSVLHKDEPLSAAVLHKDEPLSAELHKDEHHNDEPLLAVLHKDEPLSEDEHHKDEPLSAELLMPLSAEHHKDEPLSAELLMPLSAELHKDEHHKDESLLAMLHKDESLLAVLHNDELHKDESLLAVLHKDEPLDEPLSAVLYKDEPLSVLHKDEHKRELHKDEPLSAALNKVLHKDDPFSVLHNDELHKDEPLSVLHKDELYKDEPLSVLQFQEDRISKLPGDILVDILSKLKFKEAGQTSVLSHRWLNLWMYLPHIHLVNSEDPRHPRTPKQRKQHMHVFANWVNRVVDLHKSSSLREFRIVHEFNKSYQDEIDKWLEYALGMGVQNLELNLSKLGFTPFGREDRYNFPNQLLQKTKFGVQLAPKPGFSCLRELYFVCVDISGEAIEALLLKCPLLEDLRVIGSEVLVNVVVSGPFLRLKHLEIVDCRRATSITISNTNIIFLKVQLTKKLHLSLNNLPVLTEVWYGGVFPDICIVSSQLSCCLSQLTVLTLDAFKPETIMKLHKFSVLQKLRRLVLLVACCQYKSLIGLTSLIDSCPHLIEFAVKLLPLKDAFQCGVQEKATKESLKGLKVFEFYGYRGKYEYENELVMFFIENAVALEKIVIDPRETMTLLDPCERKTLLGREPFENECSKVSRKRALEKYKNLVPQQVELVVL